MKFLIATLQKSSETNYTSIESPIYRFSNQERNWALDHPDKKSNNLTKTHLEPSMTDLPPREVENCRKSTVFNWVTQH